ncbi:PREDICTED: odorant receptor 45b-like [Dinoponera quadriceps]|uniref:Odorant receptor n=1 Tax=Dinoponera quadriceps TaxID=609295 RepID=A0A6P3XNM5_DINQU|nr:PREDICTED: odorant receptor 45b-like [Dinoponera quadriceps]
MAKIKELKFELFSQPAYSPDLAHSDFHLFLNLKKWLGGKKFETNEEVIDAVNEYFEGLDISDYKNDITALEHRYEKCMSCVLICRLFWTVMLAFIEYCHYYYFVEHMYTADFIDLVDCICGFLAYGKVFIKIILFWLNQQNVIKIMSIMADDWDDCAKSDIGLRETEYKAKISDCLINFVVMLHAMETCACCSSTMLKILQVTNRTEELTYMHKFDMPFDVNTQLMYRSILFSEFIAAMTISCVAGATNILVLSLTLHAAGQMDVLRNWFTQLVPLANENKHKSTVIMLKRIVRKHQKIIDFSETIESLYSLIAFMQFTSNMIMICSLGFVIVTSIGGPDVVEMIVRSLLFFTITNLEAFIFCFAGEYLNNKSKSVGIAAYNTPWYNLKPSDGRVLLIIILRSQKQLTLTAGKMVDLSLESFASIMKASGSYLSVLLAMQ